MEKLSGTQTRIIELANLIHQSVSELQDVLSTQGISTPSFHENASGHIPPETFYVRDMILDATSELYDLLLDPLTLLFQKGAHNNMVSLQAISHLHIADLVPHGGQVSYEEISKKTGLNQQMVQRLVRHAMTMRIFREPNPGMVAHTRTSRALTTPYINDWMKVATEDVWPTATKMVEAARRWPECQEPNQTGFSLANGVSHSIYDAFRLDSRKAERFANAMKAFTTDPAFNVKYLLDNFDWASLGRAQVVDVGGSRGHVAVEIARRFRDLSLVVQDTAASIQGACAPVDVEARFRFMAHDFFMPQTVSADVYLFRWTMHNWSDKYCVRMLRALVPVLKPGATVVIQDGCMPELGTGPLWKERDMRSADLNMGAMFNGRERGRAEWEVLLATADSHFVLKGVIEPPGSALAIIHVTWMLQDEQVTDNKGI